MDQETERLEQLLRTDRTAWELFRYGYETGLARSIDHERLARIIRAQGHQEKEIQTSVKGTREFIDIARHRARYGLSDTPSRKAS